VKTGVLLYILGVIIQQAIALPLFVETKAGNKHFAKGEYNQAASHYSIALLKQSNSPRLHYNLGTAFYKQSKFSEAGHEFKRALALQSILTLNDKKVFSPAAKLRSNIYYNTGNTFFMRNNYSGAILHYERTLQINPQDQDAKYNLELAKKMKAQQQSPNEKNDKPQQKNQGPKSKPPQNTISPEDAERILDALQQEQKVIHLGVTKKQKEKTALKDW